MSSEIEDLERLIALRDVGLAVVVTLLVCGAAFGIFKAVSGSSDGRPDEERAFIDQFVSTGVVRRSRRSRSVECLRKCLADL